MSFDEWLRNTRTAVAEAFRQLLQSKHLYQSVQGPSVPRDSNASQQQRDGINTLESLIEGRWVPENPAARGPYAAFAGAREMVLEFRPPDVKLFCNSTCDRVEAFNLSAVEDFLEAGSVSHEGRLEIVQVFVLSYVCQSCKSVPEVFLVRREGARLTLSGRAPIEYVAVPREIPKPVKRFYRSAIVAHQSGETLAGIFMLRTLVEQWVRTATSRAGYADEVLEAYVESLPEDFRGRFPVLRETYKALSADIHSATGSETTFESARAEIVRHFEARRLFNLATDNQ